MIKLSDYSNKELLEAIYDVRDRVTRIEEGLKRTEKLEDKIDESYDKALEAKDIAEDAIALARANRELIIVNKESITSMKANNKWAWGLLVTSVVTIIAQFFGFGK